MGHVWIWQMKAGTQPEYLCTKLLQLICTRSITDTVIDICRSCCLYNDLPLLRLNWPLVQHLLSLTKSTFEDVHTFARHWGWNWGLHCEVMESGKCIWLYNTAIALTANALDTAWNFHCTLQYNGKPLGLSAQYAFTWNLKSNFTYGMAWLYC